jgi:hypothetical protein
MKNPMIVLALVLAVTAGACTQDATAPDEYDASSARYEGAKAAPFTTDDSLEAVTAGRDALVDQVGGSAEDTVDGCAALAARRHERSKATQQLIIDIIADPAAYGTADEVIDLLDGLAVPGTIYGDDAFGSIGWRAGWRNTLFGGLDATIHTWTDWMSDDGSNAGSLWTWSGTARNGESFELSGIELTTYDDQGLVTSVIVYYPLEGSEVRRILAEGG